MARSRGRAAADPRRPWLRKGTADNKIDGYAESRRFSPSFGRYLGAATQIEEALMQHWKPFGSTLNFVDRHAGGERREFAAIIDQARRDGLPVHAVTNLGARSLVVCPR